MAAEVSTLVVTDAAAWRSWLLSNGSTSSGVWLAIARKGVKTPTSLTLDEAIEEALCFGWINGQGRKGAARWTPRRAKSVWSKRNVGIAERLEAEGRMQDAGRAAIDAAKADGRWQNAYAGAAKDEDLTDLLEALREVPAAKATWDNMNKTNRSAIYFRLMMLKTPAGRKKRVKAYVEMLAAGETPTTQKQSAKQAENRSSKVTAKAKEPTHATPVTEVIRKTRSGIASSSSSTDNYGVGGRPFGMGLRCADIGSEHEDTPEVVP